MNSREVELVPETGDRRTELRSGVMALGILTRSLGFSRASYGPVKRFAVSSRVGAGAGVFLMAITFVAIFARQVAPHDPLVADYARFLTPPSATYLLGTDHLGRDLLSRMIFGSRTTLLVAFFAVAAGDAVGVAWGLLSGYVGGRFDLISQRFLDVILAFPSVILALLLMVALGAGRNTVVIAIAITVVPASTRVIRAVALSVKEMEYVRAAHAIGASPLRIMARHVAPQSLAPLLVIVSVHLGAAIYTEAALSFLGVGIPPPFSSWGNLLGGVLISGFRPPWWLVVFPGAMITMTILAFNLFGDALRDHLDPKLRERLQ